MTQRNFQNARNQGDGPKGKSRKSASSAKIKNKAAASVYTTSSGSKGSKASTKAGRAAQAKASKAADVKANEAAEQMRRRERAMVSMMRDMPEYKFWRRIWWFLMAIAFLVIILTWIPRMLIEGGMLSEDFMETASWASNIGFIFAIVALIGAFYIDLRKIRKLQKSQESKARNLTKSERRELDEAINAAVARDEEKRRERKANRPWNKKKQQSADDADAAEDE